MLWEESPTRMALVAWEKRNVPFPYNEARPHQALFGYGYRYATAVVHRTGNNAGLLELYQGKAR